MTSTSSPAAGWRREDGAPGAHAAGLAAGATARSLASPREASLPAGPAAGVDPAAGPADLAIAVCRAGKRYAIYRRSGDRLLEWLTRRPRHRSFWALRDVSFDVRRGEIVGIIGRNGAGKTTLLRLLTGVSPPTEGEIEIHYRMAAILELGSGFHPEFSGRENVFLGGAVLGMSDAEIERKYDGIVAFAELGEYMDMPFKTYSLGMQARLSFAVAISVEPDILIIDEALAAGDNYFMAKCFERIRQICESGATVLFVSHNLYLVQRLCKRVLWIDGGRLVADDDPAPVCRDYEAALRAQEAQREARRQEDRRRFSDVAHPDGLAGPGGAGAITGARGVGGAGGAEAAPFTGGASTPASTAGSAAVAGRSSAVWGTGELRLTAVELLDAQGRPARTFYSGEPMTIRLSYDGQASYDDLAAIVLVTRADGIPACTLDCREAGLRLPPLAGPGSFEIALDPLLLGRGRYYLSPHVYRDRHGIAAAADVLVYHDRLYEFDVERRGRPYDVACEQPATWRLLADAPGAKSA